MPPGTDVRCSPAKYACNSQAYAQAGSAKRSLHIPKSACMGSSPRAITDLGVFVSLNIYRIILKGKISDSDADISVFVFFLI